MNLPGKLQQLLSPKPKAREVYLSLAFAPSLVSGAAWSMDHSGGVEVLGVATKHISGADWDDITVASDAIIGQLEDTVGPDAIRKVAYGFAAPFLTAQGDIERSVKPAVKKLTKSLDLTPVGFVPIASAIINNLKKREGVPPSIILIEAYGGDLSVTLVSVGLVVGSKTIAHGEIVTGLETALKELSGGDALPSRMLLAGADVGSLESLKSTILSYPWPAHANFRHYPKVEIFGIDDIPVSVALAGASELATEMTEEPVIEPQETAVAQPAPVARKHDIVNDEPPLVEDEEEEKEDEGDDDALGPTLADVAGIGGGLDDGSDDGVDSGDGTLEEAEENVTVVDPEAFGFRVGRRVAEDELRSTVRQPAYRMSHSAPKEQAEEAEYGEEDEVDTPVSPGKAFNLLASVTGLPSRIMGAVGNAKAAAIVIPTVLILAGVGFGVYSAVRWFVPHAKIILRTIPKSIETKVNLTIDPEATQPDADKKTVPGKKLEKSITGEKVAAVTGKKKVGDPAKGTVTVYNKMTSIRSLKKGTRLASGSLQFTLDTDISVASASESLGGSTYGKATAAVTAVAIGPESNMPANSMFTFKDYDASAVNAVNEAALTGGTSKEVTVVSRADLDALVKSLTAELVERAKGDLAATVNGKEKLVDQTVKTEVKEKSFVEELDQEAKELHGKATVKVTGISYNEDDIIRLLSDIIEKDVPAGYRKDANRTTVDISDVSVKKDGKLAITASIKTVAQPAIDTEEIRRLVAGKKVDDIKDIFGNRFTGIAEVIPSVQPDVWKNNVPANKNNITVIVEERD